MIKTKDLRDLILEYGRATELRGNRAGRGAGRQEREADVAASELSLKIRTALKELDELVLAAERVVVDGSDEDDGKTPTKFVHTKLLHELTRKLP